MIIITQYAISLKSAVENVGVDYTYTVQDTIANETLERSNKMFFTDGLEGLASPNWGDAELCAAVAVRLGVAPESVVMASTE